MLWCVLKSIHQNTKKKINPNKSKRKEKRTRKQLQKGRKTKEHIYIKTRKEITKKRRSKKRVKTRKKCIHTPLSIFFLPSLDIKSFILRFFVLSHSFIHPFKMSLSFFFLSI